MPINNQLVKGGVMTRMCYLIFYYYSISICFRFVELFFTDSIVLVELFFTDSIVIEYDSATFSLAASPKLPPNDLITSSGMIKPALIDFSEQIVFHGVSIEMTFLLHD